MTSGDLTRRAVAACFHAPGLRLFYSIRLTPRLFRYNLLAVGLTLAAMAVVFASTRSWLPVTAAWAVGHTLWGAWLALNLPRPHG